MTDVAAACSMLVAAALHLYVFTHESILFSRPATQRMLEVAPEHAPAARLWALHQGIYNALLAGIAIAGAIGLFLGATQVGSALTIAAAASMMAAAIALVVADPRRVRVVGLLAQAVPPTVGLALLALRA